MDIDIDFVSNSFLVKLDGKNCIDVDIDNDVFIEKKAGFTLTGISTKTNPMKLDIKKLYVNKSVIEEQDEKDAFHYNIDNMMFHVGSHDRLNAEGKSLTNIMYT